VVIWLKLVRNGSTISGFKSPDGLTWTSVGSADIGAAGQVLVGLAVTSHHDGVTSAVTFDNVSVQ
jgi:regulation of enolase protein 1 (concanavalin A-like superfamily)